MAELTFRKFPAGVVAVPMPGEVLTRTAAPDQDCSELAALVLQHGIEALLRGPGPAEQVVVDVAFTSPTLDDMLAATFALRQLEGRKLPEGCSALARYAAIVRKGLRPNSKVAPEASWEAIFLAIRNSAGRDADLTDPAIGHRFKADWFRMADCILKAIEDGLDPFITSPFEKGREFAEERAFLARDQEVYRLDVQRGERWLVRIPGGPPQCSGLLLRCPTSMLFPYWSRTDREAPVGGIYLFLAVDWGKGQWVFSTDPAQKLPIQTLAEVLQAEETTHDAVRAKKDPWYDGARFSHTLVAAPKGGTALSDTEVARVVRKWSQARPIPKPRRPLPPMIGLLGRAAVATGVVLLVCLAWQHWPAPTPMPPPPMEVKWRNQDVHDFSYNAEQREVVVGKEEGIQLKKGNDNQILINAPEPFNASHWAKVQVRIKSLEAKPLPNLKVEMRLNEEAEWKELSPRPRPVSGVAEFGPLNRSFGPQQNKVLLRIATDDPCDVAVETSWPACKSLCVLAVGVTKYDHERELPCARNDAEKLAQAIAKQQDLFPEPQVVMLFDQDATRDNIIDKGLKWIEDTARSPYHLTVVILSGHGNLDRNGHYFFLPQDYRQESPSKRLPWDDIKRYLYNRPGDVFVVVDTCHSGAATWTVPPPALPGQRGGVVVMAGSLSTQAAIEWRSKWGHGLLTLALLEGLQSKHIYPEKQGRLAYEDAEGPITLKDLGNYVDKRTRSILGKDDSQPIDKSQTIVISHSPNFSPSLVTIAVNPR